MKRPFILFGLLFAISACAQTNVDLFRAVSPVILFGGGPVSFDRPLSSWATWTWHKTNINFIVDTPKPCPPEYTNVISNTNLFSLKEQRLLEELPSMYGNVTVDSFPAGTRLLGKGPGKGWVLSSFTEIRLEATNSGAQFRVFFIRLGYGNQAKEHLVEIDFINKAGDGYEEALVDHNGLSGVFLQLKHGQPDGLSADFVNGCCVVWTRYKAGMAIGKYLVWNEAGTLYMEAEFKKPHDLLHHFEITIPGGGQ